MRLNSLAHFLRYKPRTFREKVKVEALTNSIMNDRGTGSIHESLSEKCKRIVVDNFAAFPVHENIPAKHIREITQNLPVDLDANIAAEFVFDENYWKRRCVEHFLQRNCQISEHGLTWKQLYFENFIQKVLQSLVSFLRNNAVRVWKNMNLKLRRSRWQYCCESLRLAKIISLRSRQNSCWHILIWSRYARRYQT
mmetsp:Transcript_28656/g.92678  ORF Transcript_28656/g.92678 Transcript_28656/m.92678 type:complete len:195 (+) Transcript_28656:94-678(+)